MSALPILDLDPIATFTHDLPVASPLYAYPPVPAEQLAQGEQMALHTFGSLLSDIRSPRHTYFGAWRDPGPHARLRGGEGEPPTSLMLVVLCGVAPYESPTSLRELSNTFSTLDRARMRLDLARADDGFRPSYLEIEISGLALKSPFRSVWKGEEIASLDVSLGLTPPATRADPLEFAFRGGLPRRFNSGEQITEPTAHVQAEGRLEPLPKWVNY